MSGRQPSSRDFSLEETLWPHYFPQDAYDCRDQRLNLISAFEMIFNSDANCSAFMTRAIEQALASSSSSSSQLKPIYFKTPRLAELIPMHDFYQSLCTQPTAVIGALGFAISLWVAHTRCIDKSYPPIFVPRFLTLLSEHSFGDLKSSSVGQLVAIRGYVVRVSACKPLIIGASFKCGKCLGCTPAVFEDGIYNPPLECGVSDGPKRKCSNRAIELERASAQVSDYQRIKLQEIEEEEVEMTTNARIPRTFDIEARADLIDKCICGDVVQVVGVVKTMQIEPMRGARGNQKESGLHIIYMVANSIVRVKGNKQVASSSEVGRKRTTSELDKGPWASPKLQRYNDDVSDVGGGEARDTPGEDDVMDGSAAVALNGNRLREGPISQQHSRWVREIAMAGSQGGADCLSLLVTSFCPTIYGHELVKAGLLLGLFSGTRKDGVVVNVRSDIHVLVVGDPGLGKSQMLRAASTIAPRAVYVCGNTATTAGLTVAVSRDKERGKAGDVAIEAGALVLADRGVCCIDELDKMTCDPHSLLEAMEQQSISVAKSGMVTSLKSRASVLAAANPVGGTYNRKKTVCENLKMAPALLSRFDLVFILTDKADAAHDRMISEHIMRTHSLASSSSFSSSSTSSSHTFNDMSNKIEGHREGETLSMRLRRHARAMEHRAISTEALRAYLAYAKQYVHPRLSKAAAKVLQRHYLTLRAQASIGQSIPVTTRHLESLIRLAQARAKIELREEVTESDAEDCVQILEESLLDAFTADHGVVDLGRKGGLSGSNEVKTLISQLNHEAKMRGDNIFTKTQIEEVVSRLRLQRSTNDLISLLNDHAYLLRKGQNKFQLCSA